jgi:hypothetical protein
MWSFSLSLSPLARYLPTKRHNARSRTPTHVSYIHTQKHERSVNEEQSLHQEVDPRYRGSHIPSRAFRILQNFTADADGKPYTSLTNKQATSFETLIEYSCNHRHACRPYSKCKINTEKCLH